jgi:hypothetical protein
VTAVLAMCAAVLVAVTGLGNDHPAGAASVDVAVNQAQAYAANAGYQSGIAVLDTKTGQYWGDGLDRSYFASESVMKAFIAARLLVTGQMTGTVAAVAYKMITQSDDASANALYGRAGGASLINWVKSYFDIASLGYAPNSPGHWGNTHISARGMVYFYARAKANPKVGPWLLNAMHHATTYGSDGQYQYFGIASATHGFGIKQGWGQDNDDGSSSQFNSTGFVQGDRYTVAILTRGSAGSYGAPISSMLTQEARILLPGQKIDDPANHNPTGTLDWIGTSGSSVVVRGWAVDPDARGSELTYGIYEDGRRVASGITNVSRPDVNAALHTTGIHGYQATVHWTSGTHRLCIMLGNIGEGVGHVSYCHNITVHGSPIGRLDQVTTSTTHITTLRGWAYDPDVAEASIDVAIYDGKVGQWFLANLARPDVDKTLHIGGNHAFVVQLPNQAPGVHTYKLFGIDRGVPEQGNPLLGTAVIRVP